MFYVYDLLQVAGFLVGCVCDRDSARKRVVEGLVVNNQDSQGITYWCIYLLNDRFLKFSELIMGKYVGTIITSYSEIR